MNWISIARAGVALAIYLALMGAYLAGFTAQEYALFLALVLSLALFLQATDSAVPQARVAVTQPAMQSVIPSLSDSMAELHALQNEIGDLQAQFAADARKRSSDNSSFGSARQG